MIQLDTVSFTLFELSPVPYEVYMKSYGCSNTLQVIITLYIPMHLILGNIFNLSILEVTVNIFDPVNIQQKI